MKSSLATQRKHRLLLSIAGCALLLLAWYAIYSCREAPDDPLLQLAIPSGKPDQPEPPPASDPPWRGDLFVRRDGVLEAQAEPAPAAPLNIRETFDQTQPNALPAGWSRWSSDPAGTVGASATRSLSAPNGLAFSGNTASIIRAWLGAPLVADAQVSSMIYLDTLIPAQVLVRGSSLNTATPSYYAVSVTRGMDVLLLRVVRGNSTTLGSLKSATYISQKWVKVTLSASGNTLRVQVFRPDTSQYLSATGQWQATAAWALNVNDAQIPAAGQLGMGKGASVGGTFSLDDFSAVPPDPIGPVTPPQPPPLPVVVQPVPRPAIPRHYDHIRIAMLMYAASPFTDFEQQLLRSSVDLVIPNPSFMTRIKQVAPNTPMLIYTNTSSLYMELLTDWLAYADRRGQSREEAFYHATRPVAFRGDSSSSRQVTWFWGVHRGGQPLTDVTSTARSGTGRVNFGALGETVNLGHPDRFRELNLNLASGAGGGWTAALEYPTTVDATGAPTRWAALTTLSNSTNGLARTGTILFDPPADWKPAVVNNSARLYYVRFRTTAGGTAPVAVTLLGRDYVQANGTKSGIVPVFDSNADQDRDGYLNDQEYLRRGPGKDARFVHESRMLTEGYGQMRPATNPSSALFRDWSVDFHQRQLTQQPLAAGFFMDNAGGKAPVKAEDVAEGIGNYARDSGVMLNAIWRGIGPRWVLANTGGAGTRADPIVQQSPAYFEEFGIRPMSHNWAFFEELAATVARRKALATPAPIVVLDSHPQRGAVTDPRTQMGVLAYYYLLADPDSTFLTFFGGHEPASSWARHWITAAAYNIGRPAGNWSQRATGPDPSSPNLSYRLYQRNYQNALVLYKPVSHTTGVVATPSLGDETATRHDLGGTYRLLRTDGSTGEPITSISLRNGEGAILIKP